ncbi:MAG: hypothetical protein K8T89_05800 [Planctomycetes bacterium]|nr:hypothetical protein [Planctomycetota bacterium]
MTRIFTLFALVVAAGTAQAQTPYPATMPYGQGYSGPPPMAAQQYQGVPNVVQPAQEATVASKKIGFIRGLFTSKASKECNTCDGKGKAGLLSGNHPALAQKGYFSAPKHSPPPAANGGTLVFPNHPFVRSPRDFFMQD